MPGAKSEWIIKESLIERPIKKTVLKSEAVYIGETGRSLGTRQKEHQASVRLGKTETSALSKHVLSQDHEISWAGTRIVEVENCMTKRWKEAWCTVKTRI